MNAYIIHLYVLSIILLGVNKNQFSLFQFHRDEDQESEGCFDIHLDDHETQCVYHLESKDNNDTAISGIRGVFAVSSMYENLLNDDNQQNHFNFDEYRPTDEVLTGIFFQKTARDIATRIIAKTILNSKCSVCIIGVHCVVSICRLIRATRSQLQDEVNLVVNIIDMSQAKLKMLSQLIKNYLQPSVNFKLVCIQVNFLN